MSRNTENSPYITVVTILGVCHVNKMEWDTRADDYIVSVSKQVNCAHAQQVRDEWAQAEGLEVR